MSNGPTEQPTYEDLFGVALPKPRPSWDDSAPYEVKKLGVWVPVSDEQLRQIEEDIREAREAEARWNAMTPAEREQARAEADARREAEKAARTCEHCGCDPDEHGGY
jgi:hypothetical protein